MNLKDNLGKFPFLFGGTFIEAAMMMPRSGTPILFPFLFGGTFIEADFHTGGLSLLQHFPSFSEGLSLRRLP